MMAAPHWRTVWAQWLIWSWSYAAASCRTISWWWDESVIRWCWSSHSFIDTLTALERWKYSDWICFCLTTHFFSVQADCRGYVVCWPELWYRSSNPLLQVKGEKWHHASVPSVEMLIMILWIWSHTTKSVIQSGPGQIQAKSKCADWERLAVQQKSFRRFVHRPFVMKISC